MRMHEWKDELVRRRERKAEQTRVSRELKRLPYNDDGFSLYSTEALIADIREDTAKFYGFAPEERLTGDGILRTAPGMWGEARSTGTEHRPIAENSVEARARKKEREGLLGNEERTAPTPEQEPADGLSRWESIEEFTRRVTAEEERAGQKTITVEYFQALSFVLGYTNRAPAEVLESLNELRRTDVVCLQHSFTGPAVGAAQSATCVDCGLTKLAYTCWIKAVAKNVESTADRIAALVHREEQLRRGPKR